VVGDHFLVKNRGGGIFYLLSDSVYALLNTCSNTLLLFDFNNK
jgi:hypothetical protein